MTEQPKRRLFLSFSGFGEVEIDKVMVSSIHKGSIFERISTGYKCLSSAEYLSRNFIYDIGDGTYQLAPHIFDTITRRKINKPRAGFSKVFQYISVKTVGTTKIVTFYDPVGRRDMAPSYIEEFNLKTHEKTRRVL